MKSKLLNAHAQIVDSKIVISIAGFEFKIKRSVDEFGEFWDIYDGNDVYLGEFWGDDFTIDDNPEFAEDYKNTKGFLALVQEIYDNYMYL